MTEMREATAAELVSWFDDWQRRLQDWYRLPGLPSAWTDQHIAERVALHQEAPESAVLTLTADGAVVGMLAVAAVSQDGRPGTIINDIAIVAGHRRKGHGRAAIRLAEGWGRDRHSDVVWTLTNPADPAHAALFARYPARGHQMVKPLSACSPLPAGLAGRPMTEPEFADWRQQSVDEYATEIAESGAMTADLARTSASAQFDQLLPDGLETADHTFLCLVAENEVVATNWIGHHRTPGASWVYGVETHEKHRGKGYGRAAMVIGENATLDAGDNLLGLNVFGQNSVAIGMYNAMGYRAYDDGRSTDL